MTTQTKKKTVSGPIYLVGLFGIDTPEIVERIEKADRQKIKARLTELQSGYCEKGDGKPKVQVIEKDGYVVIEASSNNCDWGYVMKMKKETWDNI